VQLDGAPALSVIGDVTGDGRNDVVLCLAGRATMVVVPQLAGGGGLGEPFQLDASGMPLRPALGDANRDGRTDLFALSGFGDRINLWLARGDGPAGRLAQLRHWPVRIRLRDGGRLRRRRPRRRRHRRQLQQPRRLPAAHPRPATWP